MQGRDHLARRVLKIADANSGRGRKVRRSRVRRAAAIAAAAFLVAAAGGPAWADPTPSVSAAASASPAPTASPKNGGSANGAPSTAGSDGRPRIHGVVLVDESGSETDPTVTQERDAASIIATSGQLDPASQVGVVGFGSDDYDPNNPNSPSKHPHGATDEACPLTQVGLADFHTCLNGLHKRTIEEGNGTDHAAAIKKALDMLRAKNDPSAFNVIFLLTDGGLDVANSPQYCAPEADPTATTLCRNNKAKDEVTGSLAAEAKSLGVQVWPVGFGSALDPDWLPKLVIGAGVSPDCAGTAVSAPAVRIATTAADIWWTLDQVLANATCQGYVGPKTGTGQPGTPVTLSLDIPVTASSATINAVKRDPSIKITYTDPNGVAVNGSGTQNGSVFKLNDSAPDTESLFIANPVPGAWHVTFTWPPGAQAQTVAADLTWLGQLNSYPQLDPVSPTPGQQATVTVQLQTSRGKPIDPRQLAALTFNATLTGDGFDPVQVALHDDGQGQDKKAGDGFFTGAVTIPPTATGLLELTGRVTGEGLRAAVQSVSYEIAGSSHGGGYLTLPLVNKVQRGAVFTGSFTAHNPGSSAKQVQLVLAGLPGTAVSPSTVSVPAGATDFTQQLTFTVAGDAAYDSRDGRVRALDSRAVVYDDQRLTFSVVPPPGFWDKYWWAVALLIIAAVVAAAVLALLAYRRHQAADVSRLQAVAYRPQGATVDLPAPARWARQFRFVLRDNGQVATLELAAGDGPDVYSVRRAAHGQLTVTMPNGNPRTDQPNTPIPLPSGAFLRIVDRRAQTATDAGSGWGDPGVPAGGGRPQDPWSNAFANGNQAGGWDNPFAQTQPVVPDPHTATTVQPGQQAGGGGGGYNPFTGTGPGGYPPSSPHGGQGGYGQGGGYPAADATTSEADTIRPGHQGPPPPPPPPPPSAPSGAFGDDWGNF
jgi:hypothetical protein